MSGSTAWLAQMAARTWKHLTCKRDQTRNFQGSWHFKAASILLIELLYIKVECPVITSTLQAFHPLKLWSCFLITRLSSVRLTCDCQREKSSSADWNWANMQGTLSLFPVYHPFITLNFFNDKAFTRVMSAAANQAMLLKPLHVRDKMQVSSFGNAVKLPAA